MISAICEFLCLWHIGAPDCNIHKAQGLAIMPGLHNDLRSGVVQRFSHRGTDPKSGQLIDFWEELPDQIETFEYTDDSHALWDLQPWTYSAGTESRDFRWTYNDRNGRRRSNTAKTPPHTPPKAAKQSSSDHQDSQQSSSQSQGLIMDALKTFK